MCCCFRRKLQESPEALMERGEWMLKTSQWMLVVGIPITINQMLAGENWGLAVAIAAVLGMAGLLGFNCGICLREKARSAMRKNNTD